MIRQSSSCSSASISQSRSFRVEDGLLIEEILSTTDTQQQQEEEDTTVPPSKGTNDDVTVNDENANNVNDSSTTTSSPSPTCTRSDSDNKTKDQHEIIIPTKTSSSTAAAPTTTTNPITKSNNFISALLGNCTKPRHRHHHHHHHNAYDDDDDELTIVDMPSPADIIAGHTFDTKSKTSISTISTTDSKTYHNDTVTTIPHVECQIDPITKQCQNAGLYSTCKHSLYGHPTKSKSELKDIFEFNTKSTTRTMVKNKNNESTTFSNHTTTSSTSTSEEEILQNQLLWKEGGLLWYSTILPNDYNRNPKSLKMLQKKDYDDINNCIKPRRGTLAIVQDDFFHSLVKIPLVKDDDKIKDSNNMKKDGMNVIIRDDDDGEYDNESVVDDDDYEIFDNDDSKRNEHETTHPQHEMNNPSQHLHLDLHPIPDTTNNQSSKWIFSGVLNGFPGLQHLELLKIEYKSTLVPRWRTHWSTYDNPQDKAPTYPKKVIGLMEVRAKLREPGWSAMGWSKDSLGYVLYYQSPETRKVPRVLYGTNIIKQLEEDRYEQARVVGGRLQPSPKCVKVHMISHRYAMINEKWKNRITYHSFALLEWDHGKYCTVIELAFLNGLSGYNGRCNHAVVS
jgi:hypothetical protein